MEVGCLRVDKTPHEYAVTEVKLMQEKSATRHDPAGE